MAAYGLVAAGKAALPGLRPLLNDADPALAVRVLDVLGDIGPPAAPVLPELVGMMRHDDANVRRYAVEAVGVVAQGRPFDGRLMVDALGDEDALVRRNAALAVARLGPDIGDGSDLVAPLAENLYHWHHHVRGWSIEALQRLGSPSATRTALCFLMAARWDPMSKSGDTPPDARAPKNAVRAATA